MNGIRDHKKMLCIFLSLVCCLTLFAVPSFAITSVDDYVYLIPYYSSAPLGVSYESLAFIYTYSYNKEPAQSTNLYSYSTDNDSVYIVYYYSGSSVCSISLSNESFILNGAHGKFTTSFSSYNKTQTGSLNNDGLYQYNSSSGNANGFPYSVDSIFDSYDSAYSYISNYVINGGSSSGSIQPVPTDVSSITDFQNMLLYQSSTDKYVYSDNSNLACAYFNNNVTVDLRVCSLEQLSPNGFFSAVNGSGVVICPINVTYEGSNVYYGTVSIDGTLNPDIKVYTDESTFNTEMYDYLSALPTPPTPDVPTLTYSFDIPNGWYYVFSQVDPSEEVTITATFAQNSTLFSNTWSPNTMYWDRQTGSTPSVYNPMPNTQNQSPLVLTVTGDTNLMGQGKNGITTLSQGNGTFLGIYNPTYRQVNSQNTNQFLQNPTLHVSCPSGFNYVVADSLKETLTEGGITSSVVHSDSKVLVSGVDENGNPVVGWKEPDGTTDTDAPVSGGSNQLPEQFSISDYLQQLRESLDTFANNFVSLLKSPISHVQQLISAGTEYFSMIRGLYAWLPENVQNTLESAMIVSLSIGVIGLLL